MAKKDEAVADETTEATEAKESKKDPKPDGYVSPIEYSEHRSEVEGKFIRPQTIYGLFKDLEKNGFPAEKNTDGRWMIPVEAADAWYAERKQKRAAKKAEKAAKEAAAEASDEAVAED